jgi:PEP-CTERM motif-containing protein
LFGDNGNGVSFSVQFTGSGLATLQLQRYLETNQYFPHSVTYTFQTPEPDSFILLGSGVAGLFLIGYRKMNWPRV